MLTSFKSMSITTPRISSRDGQATCSLPRLLRVATSVVEALLELKIDPNRTEGINGYGDGLLDTASRGMHTEPSKDDENPP
ncbi:hypothetical protein J3458_015135 [Metarhizium acridum]|uniref:uncharacterized protein n=1 Tax=Metarhizium acridum TaxID=92637 RepID=UPI001C6CB6F4|nr:hypothetical protein J3458_015135 [Metarhizium acridum]